MKKVFRIGFIYIGVLLLAFLATTIFCGAFLFFYRDGNIFGIKYISSRDTMYVKQDKDISELKTIDVSASDLNVTVEVSDNVDTLVGAMHIRMFGYAFESKAHANLAMEYNEITNTAIFTAKEPKGWLNKKGSYIKIFIPEQWVDNYYNINIKTAKGDITIGGTKNIKTNNLSLESSKGDINILNSTINNNIYIDCGKGLAYIDDKCVTNGEISAQLSVNSGKINLTKINSEKFKLGVVEIVKNKKGLIAISKAAKVSTFENIKGGGDVQIGEVDIIDFSSLDTDVTVAKINKLSNIKITGRGDVYVKEAVGMLTVDGYNGNIKIDKALNHLILYTNKGGIDINGANKLVSAESNSGDINISFDKNAGDFILEDNNNRAVFILTNDGTVNVDGLQNGTIKATGSGKINLFYNKVVEGNSISAQSGSVYIVVPAPKSNIHDNDLNLKVVSLVGADVKVGVGGNIEYDSTAKEQDYIGIYNSGLATSNTLEITSTTGKIKVRSSDLTGF